MQDLHQLSFDRVLVPLVLDQQEVVHAETENLTVASILVPKC